MGLDTKNVTKATLVYVDMIDGRDWFYTLQFWQYGWAQISFYNNTCLHIFHIAHSRLLDHSPTLGLYVNVCESLYLLKLSLCAT